MGKVLTFFKIHHVFPALWKKMPLYFLLIINLTKKIIILILKAHYFTSEKIETIWHKTLKKEKYGQTERRWLHKQRQDL